jgi:BioD-like phosphotransacetylase family protein
MRLASAGRPVAVSRVIGGQDDPNAADDARTFAALPFAQPGERRVAAADLPSLLSTLPAGTTLILEAPRAADIAALAESADARVVLVERGASSAWGEAAALEGRLIGSIATAVPEGALDDAREALAGRAGMSLGVIPEDRGLYGPSIGDITDALQAEVIYDSGGTDEVMEYVVIAPINSDGGRPYFWRYPRKAVVTRVDKPDVILSAIHHGARCMVLCGQQPPMLYIVDRARHEEITLLLSHRSTVATMRLLEGVFERSRFQGEFKLERMMELLDRHADVDAALAGVTA